MIKTDKTHLHGVATRRVFSGQRLKELLEAELKITINTYDFTELCDVALKKGITSERLGQILDQSAKKLFQENAVWRFLKKNLNIDLAIPFLTGFYTTKAIKSNLIVNTGHKAYADQIGGTTTTPFTAMAYGTGAVAASASDTALGAEVARGAATVTNTTTTTTGDTEQWVKTFTAGGSQAITEEGILNNNTSGGILLARQVFSAINMVNGDTIQFTHKIQS